WHDRSRRPGSHIIPPGRSSRRGPSAQASPPDDGEARNHDLALVRGADSAEIDETPVPAVASDEREEPARFQDAIPIEVRPLGTLPPAALAPDAKVHVGWYANEPELARVEPQAFLEHPRTLEEQGVLDVGPSEATTPRQGERLEKLRHGLLALWKAFDETWLGVDGERHVAQSCGVGEDLGGKQ